MIVVKPLALVLSDAQIIGQMQKAFANIAKPEHFTDFSHCEECAEHEHLLQSRDLETLSVTDVGNPGWDPICFITGQGFCYYFPALARLALSEPTNGFDWYLPQLLFHLNYDGPQNQLLQLLSRQQRQAVTVFLRHVAESRGEQIVEAGCKNELEKAIDLWSAS